MFCFVNFRPLLDYFKKLLCCAGNGKFPSKITADTDQRGEMHEWNEQKDISGVTRSPHR